MGSWSSYVGFENAWHVSFDSEDVNIDIRLTPQKGSTHAEVLPPTCGSLDWLPADAPEQLSRIAAELGFPAEVNITLG